MPHLLDPYKAGALTLSHRIVMAPMTRSRACEAGIPNPVMAMYYQQRAGAALIVSEATQISRQGQGYSFTPGIYTPEQIAGWRQITEAVHSVGGRIYCQLWHVGRMSHSSFHEDRLPVAPSALAPDASVWMWGNGVGSMVECPTPRALKTEEITGIVEQFRRGAANAIAAGFDGVEIHGANGYLIDQFLRTTSNHRTDRYGGSIENRVRLAVEVAETVAAEIGAERVGVRLAPYLTARNMDCPEAIASISHLTTHLDRIGVGYVHLVEADWNDAPEIPESFRHDIRDTFRGTIIVAGRYDQQRAEQIVESGLADLVAFGRPFIANPDLPDRIANGYPWTDFDPATLFGGGDPGYTTYPTWRPPAYGDETSTEPR